jgi:hypothetical protein
MTALKRGRVAVNTVNNSSESGQGACILRRGRARGTNASESEEMDVGAEIAPGPRKRPFMDALKKEAIDRHGRGGSMLQARRAAL